MINLPLEDFGGSDAGLEVLNVVEDEDVMAVATLGVVAVFGGVRYVEGLTSLTDCLCDELVVVGGAREGPGDGLAPNAVELLELGCLETGGPPPAGAI